MAKPGLNPYAARSVRYRSAGKDSGQFKGRAGGSHKSDVSQVVAALVVDQID
ncbi:hypothetical protein WN51_11272 [Melipona quadrifasciata]|uniref:Uncharacterized protein n=1 Tax=Melipona quadrifasciata TaxID=166423 RepID=A0A0N0BHW1_9HYME|nr:hypothetical protein WN51_11272 [Melipona quadrifasciata]